MKNIKTLLEEAALQFSVLSKTPRLDAELLLCHVLKKDRTYVFSHPEKTLSFDEYQQWQDLLEKRCLQMPIAYLIGQKSFWDLDLTVNEHTLIPRPETELLVEIVLEKFFDSELDPAVEAAGRQVAVEAAGRRDHKRVEMLDLGTGSGAIALALAHERPHWKISAVDFSQEALKIAKINAEKNNIHNVEFFHSDWFSIFLPFRRPAAPTPTSRRPAASTAGSSSSFKWDIIVSNPPYLDENDSHLLTEEIRHEPRSALVAKNNGLEDIEKIIKESRQHLKCDGMLFIEHGCDQGESVRKLFSLCEYNSIETVTDLAGLERVTLGRLYSYS